MKKLMIFLVLVLLFACEQNTIELSILEGSWEISVSGEEICDDVSDMASNEYVAYPILEFYENGSGINWPEPEYMTYLNSFTSFTWEFFEDRFLIIKKPNGEELTAVIEKVYDFDDEISFYVNWIEIETNSPYSNGKDVMLKIRMNLSRDK